MGLSHKSELTPHGDGLVIPNIKVFWFDLIFIKKINKLVFFKKINRNLFKSINFGSVILEQKSVQIDQFQFDLVLLRFGYVVLY